MKKLTLMPYLLFICIGLLISTGGLFQCQIAFCLEEEEEPAQARPRPDTRPNPVEKQGVMTPTDHMRFDPTRNKQKMVADDGEHGDRLQLKNKQKMVADDGEHGDGLQP